MAGLRKGFFWSNEEFHEYRANIEGNYLKTVDLVPALADRVRNGHREERFMGSAEVTYFFRKPFGPGWALVRDAGYQKDAITAQGITDAFKHAELLAGAIDEGMAERRPLDEALAGYEQERNESVAPIYDFSEPPAPAWRAEPAAVQPVPHHRRGAGCRQRAF